MSVLTVGMALTFLHTMQGTRVFAKVSVGDSIKARVVKVKKRDMAKYASIKLSAHVCT